MIYSGKSNARFCLVIQLVASVPFSPKHRNYTKIMLEKDTCEEKLPLRNLRVEITYTLWHFMDKGTAGVLSAGFRSFRCWWCLLKDAGYVVGKK